MAEGKPCGCDGQCGSSFPINERYLTPLYETACFLPAGRIILFTQKGEGCRREERGVVGKHVDKRAIAPSSVHGPSWVFWVFFMSVTAERRQGLSECLMRK